MRSGSDYDSTIGDLREQTARLAERSEHLATKVDVEKRVAQVEERVATLETTITNWWRLMLLAVGLSGAAATMVYIVIRFTVSGAS